MAGTRVNWLANKLAFVTVPLTLIAANVIRSRLRDVRMGFSVGNARGLCVHLIRLERRSRSVPNASFYWFGLMSFNKLDYCEVKME